MQVWQFLLCLVALLLAADETMPKLKGKRAATAAKGRSGDGKFASEEYRIAKECLNDLLHTIQEREDALDQAWFVLNEAGVIINVLTEEENLREPRNFDNDLIW